MLSIHIVLFIKPVNVLVSHEFSLINDIINYDMPSQTKRDIL